MNFAFKPLTLVCKGYGSLSKLEYYAAKNIVLRLYPYLLQFK